MSKFITLILLIIVLFIFYCYQNGFLDIKFNLPSLNFIKKRKKKVGFKRPIVEEPEEEKIKSEDDSLNLDEISISDLNSTE